MREINNEQEYSPCPKCKSVNVCVARDYLVCNKCLHKWYAPVGSIKRYGVIHENNKIDL